MSLHCFDGCSLSFATTCGQSLQFSCGLQKEINVEFELFRLDGCAPSWENSGALGLSIWVPDANGNVWKATARISSEYLHDLLSIANTNTGMLLRAFVDLSSEQQALFLADCDVRGIRFFTDDRAYRRYQIREVSYPLQYKYRSVEFDIAVVDLFEWYGHQNDAPPMKVSVVVVRVRFSEDESDEELFRSMATRQRYDPLPSLAFVSPNEDVLLWLLRGNDAFQDKLDKTWERARP